MSRQAVAVVLFATVFSGTLGCEDLAEKVPVGVGSPVDPPPGPSNGQGVPTAALASLPGVGAFDDLSTGGPDLAMSDQLLPAVSLVVTVQPSNGRSGLANPATITVEARDAAGKLISAFADTITVTLEGGTGGAQLSGAAAQPAVAGAASWNDLRVDRIGRGYSLRFSATGLNDAVSSPFDIGGSMLRFTRLPECVAVQQYCLSGPPAGDTTTRIIASDSTGALDPFATGTVTLSLADDAGNVSMQLAQADLQDGVLELPTVSLLPWGMRRLVATATNYASASSDVFRIRFSRVHFLTQPYSAQAGSQWTPSVQIELTDELGARDELVDDVNGVSSIWSLEPSCYVQLGYFDATVSDGLITIDKVPTAPPLQGCRFQIDNFQAPKSDPFDIQLGAANGVGVGGAFVAKGAPSYIDTWLTAVGNGDRIDDGVSITLTPSAAAAPQIPAPATMDTTGGVARFGPYLFPDVRGFTLTAAAAGLPPTTVNVFVGAWGDLTSSHGHAVRVLAADSQTGDTVLAVDNATYTLATSVDGGWNWKSSGLYAPLLGAIAPSNASIGYASDEVSLWRTDDAGTTWSTVQAPRPWLAKSLSVHSSDPLNVIVAGAGIWQSLDGGVTFVSRSGATVSRLVRAPSAPNIVYAVTPVGFFVSVDGGASWSTSYVGASGSPLSDLCVDATNPDRLYAGGPAVYRSDNAGLSWSVAANPGYPGVGSITCDPQATGVVYSQSLRKAFTNGGQTAVTWGDFSTATFGSMFIVAGSPNVMYTQSRKTVTGGY